MEGCLWKIRREQFGNVQTKATGNLIERQQAGILFDPQFVKLEKFVANAAFFGGDFLRPSACFSQRPQFLLEPCCNGVLHASNVQFAI